MPDSAVPPEAVTAECDAELRLHAFADGSAAFLTCDLKMAEHPGLNHHDPVYETWWRQCDQSCGHPHVTGVVSLLA